ncbi:PilT protein [Nostoc sphaeroides CCNUC1]|uniref:PilT protein n=1 Tax=Nostoc sphaeroides CCNUC1 TaxID=2653204 RepID=A0A5P8VWV7_9NOSO|nr:PilT protein [Nostoc sphaeroides CCNUC1]
MCIVEVRSSRNSVTNADIVSQCNGIVSQNNRIIQSAQFAIRFFAHSQLKPQDLSWGLNPALFKIYLSINKFRGLYHQGIIGQCNY